MTTTSSDGQDTLVLADDELPADEPGQAQLSVAAVADKPDGPVAAAIIAAGVGSLTLGVATTAAMISETVRDWLILKDDVGPLSGKTSLAVVVWLVAWAVLHVRMRASQVSIVTAFVIGLVLIGGGVVGTFPPFFQAFGSR